MRFLWFRAGLFRGVGGPWGSVVLLGGGGLGEKALPGGRVANREKNGQGVSLPSLSQPPQAQKFSKVQHPVKKKQTTAQKATSQTMERRHCTHLHLARFGWLGFL